MKTMLQSTRNIWRAVRDAGDAGLRTRAVMPIAPELGIGTLTDRLTALRRHGYVRFVGAPRCGVWKVGSRVPLGEAPQFGAPPVEVDEAAIQAFMDQAGGPRRVDTPFHPAPAGVPRGVPSSVWALAAMCDVTAGQP